MHLFEHQQKSIDKIISNKGIGALYWDCGTGKTLTALKIYEHYKASSANLKLLVVCPISVIEGAWSQDIEKFTKFGYENLRVSHKLDKDVMIINYQSIISNKFKGLLRDISGMELMIVLDECQAIKSYNTKTTKFLLALSKYAQIKIIMSATPAPNGEHEYWSQMCFLSTHILGDNFFKFRNKYCALIRGKSVIPLHGLGKRDMMTMMQRGYEMKIHPDAKHDLVNRMSSYCIYVNKREVLDLPDEIDQVRYVAMTSEQAKAYKEMWDELVTEINGETISVNLALAKISKVRQITSGFSYIQGKEPVMFKTNPKINELKEVVDEIGNKPIIIFCQYKWEIKTICELFHQRAFALYSETEEKDSVIKQFTTSSSGILVAHPASGGIGLNFNNCDYMIFFSLDYSYMNYYQARGRIMRAGKKNNATYIHILCEKSIDMEIYKSLQNKEDNDKLFRRLING